MTFDHEQFHADNRQGGKKYKTNPCKVCGWGRQMEIHNPNNFKIRSLWTNWAHKYEQ